MVTWKASLVRSTMGGVEKMRSASVSSLAVSAGALLPAVNAARAARLAAAATDVLARRMLQQRTRAANITPKRSFVAGLATYNAMAPSAVRGPPKA